VQRQSKSEKKSSVLTNYDLPREASRAASKAHRHITWQISGAGEKTDGHLGAHSQKDTELRVWGEKGKIRGIEVTLKENTW